MRIILGILCFLVLTVQFEALAASNHPNRSIKEKWIDILLDAVTIDGTNFPREKIKLGDGLKINILFNYETINLEALMISSMANLGALNNINRIQGTENAISDETLPADIVVLYIDNISNKFTTIKLNDQEFNNYQNNYKNHYIDGCSSFYFIYMEKNTLFININIAEENIKIIGCVGWNISKYMGVNVKYSHVSKEITMSMIAFCALDILYNKNIGNHITKHSIEKLIDKRYC